MIALSSLTIIIVVIYLLALITDEYFIVSLDQIAQRWKLPANVAGASLMAMGSSAPELAIALLALFKDGGAHSDLGIGTIVGSAVFNILVITGVSAIARPAQISWRVVVRDVVMYVASIALLFATFADGTITLLEALAFLILYAVYLFILFQWDAFAPGEESNVMTTRETKQHAESAGQGWFTGLNRQIARMMGFAMGDARQAYLRTFVVSVVFISGLSWVLVEQAVVFSNAVGIPPVIVALAILAAGTSVPDMLASIIVARQGRGEMAVANAIGSNIFDILIGLGLPWLIAMLVQGKVVHVATQSLWLSTLILLVTVIVLFVFLTTERLLTRREGWALLSVYSVYGVWILLAG
ncbi:calcium/sodium antiporter [Chloroflexi bacterium TSY]|nr:calcium/sodium antiporter [Chloroflexi bacterium TSY]